VIIREILNEQLNMTIYLNVQDEDTKFSGGSSLWDSFQAYFGELGGVLEDSAPPDTIRITTDLSRVISNKKILIRFVSHDNVDGEDLLYSYRYYKADTTEPLPRWKVFHNRSYAAPEFFEDGIYKFDVKAMDRSFNIQPQITSAIIVVELSKEEEKVPSRSVVVQPEPKVSLAHEDTSHQIGTHEGPTPGLFGCQISQPSSAALMNVDVVKRLALLLLPLLILMALRRRKC